MDPENNKILFKINEIFKKSIFILFLTIPKILEMTPTHKPFPTLEKARNAFSPISHRTREKPSLKHCRN